MGERLQESGYSVIFSSRHLGKPLRLLDMLWTAVARKQHYDVTHLDVFSGPAFIWAETVAWTLRRLGKPYILTLRGGNLPGFAVRWPGRVHSLLRTAAAVTAPSPYLQRAFLPVRGDTQLLPNPIELSRYPFRRRETCSPRLVWLRAFHEIYDPRMAIEVLSDLRKQGMEATLCMVGPDKGDGSLQRTQAKAQELHVEKWVEFSGQIAKENVPVWLNRGDIFLNTTTVDNTPVSVIEAMACGLPVVTTNVGGIPELLCDGEEGLLVPSGDAIAMTRAITSLLQNPELAKRLSLAARKKVEAFDWSVILPQWEKLLTEVARKPMPRPDYGTTRLRTTDHKAAIDN